jgi:endonuclease-3
VEEPGDYTQFAPAMTSSFKSRIRTIHRRLVKEYGEPPPPPPIPALDELIFTILSQNTNDTNRDRAYAVLRERFPDWASVAEALTGELADAIRIGGLGDTKAGYIQGVLRHVYAERGEYSLDFLKGLSDAEALEYLRTLPGVGAKTAHCVLVFSLGRDVFPVDTHILRVSKRLGLIPEKTDLTKAHELWAAMVPDDLGYGLHKNIINHGRKVCTARKPLCGGCVLADLCPSAESAV